MSKIVTLSLMYRSKESVVEGQGQPSPERTIAEPMTHTRETLSGTIRKNRGDELETTFVNNLPQDMQDRIKELCKDIEEYIGKNNQEFVETPYDEK